MLDGRQNTLVRLCCPLLQARLQETQMEFLSERAAAQAGAAPTSKTKIEDTPGPTVGPTEGGGAAREAGERCRGATNIFPES